MTAAWVGVLAEGDPTSKTGSIGPGLTAFLVVLALVVATVLLMRSMLRHIRKVPATFGPAESSDPQPGADGDGTTGGSAGADG